MPITAVLSRTLHEALGNEAAADLVDWMQQVDSQRAELRDLNELNFARIESRFKETDARFGEVRQEMRAGVAELKLAIANAEVRSEHRFADLLKWSFLFWCGTFAAAALTRWGH